MRGDWNAFICLCGFTICWNVARQAMTSLPLEYVTLESGQALTISQRTWLDFHQTQRGYEPPIAKQQLDKFFHNLWTVTTAMAFTHTILCVHCRPAYGTHLHWYVWVPFDPCENVDIICSVDLTFTEKKPFVFVLNQYKSQWSTLRGKNQYVLKLAPQQSE